MNKGSCDQQDRLLDYLHHEARTPPDVSIHIGAPGADLLAKIIEHRNAVYRQHGLEYLIEDSTGSIPGQRELDARSTYIWAIVHDSLSGSLRMLGNPYEMDLVVLPRPSRPDNYLEISRLVVHDGTPSVARKLMCCACIHGLQEGYAGVLAICRSTQRRLFERLGLRSQHESPFKVPSRNDDAYWLMEANWGQLASHHLHGDSNSTTFHEEKTAK